MHDQPSRTKHGLCEHPVFQFFDRVASGREGVRHTSLKTRSRTRRARARVTVAKRGSFPDNYFHRASACFDCCVHHRTLDLLFTRLNAPFNGVHHKARLYLASHVLGSTPGGRNHGACILYVNAQRKFSWVDPLVPHLWIHTCWAPLSCLT
jgi:hypothetical protein